jgi:malate synthase
MPPATAWSAASCVVTLANGAMSGLLDPRKFVGYQGDAAAPQRCCCSTTACTSTSSIDRSTAIGKTDPAGISDVVLEAALSTILDLEDSVAAVDAEDKILGYATGWAS